MPVNRVIEKNGSVSMVRGVMLLINEHMHAHKEGHTKQIWHLNCTETVSD